MTIALDPPAAAARLRPMLKMNPVPALPPEDQQKESYLEKVCVLLDIEPTTHHQTFIAGLLAKAEIEPHFADAYPKAINFRNKKTGRLVSAVYPIGHANSGQPVVLEDEDDEKAYDKSAVPDIPVPADDTDDPPKAYADWEVFTPGETDAKPVAA